MAKRTSDGPANDQPTAELEHAVDGDSGGLDEARDDQGAVVADLFDRHYASLCRLAYVIIGDEQRAEDLVSDAFVRVFTGWWRVSDPGRAHAYLRSTTVNLARSAVRRSSVERRVTQLVGRREPTATPGADDRNPMAAVVWRAVLALPARQRAAVVLRYYEDLSDEVIAETLRCSTGTVRSQLFKARASLSRALSIELDA